MSAEGAAQDTSADLRFSTGVEYSTGKYGGADDIEELYVPFTFRAGFDRIGFRLTVPWLSVTGPEDTIMTFYDLYVSDTANFVVDVTGKIKFGTADETRGLGTGENDYTLQLDAYRFFDKFSLQGTAGYRLRGDPPGVALNDVLLASVGAAYMASDNALVGMYFDYRESAISGTDDIQELSGFASFRLGSAWRMEVYAFTGLTDSSTDFGGGILFSTDLSKLRVSDRQDY
jgi:hypothetical protein